MAPRIKKSKNLIKTTAAPATEPSYAPGEEVPAISGELDTKKKKSKARSGKQRGIVVIRHLPHGFFEEQMKGYFEQFGKVTRLRLARSKHTGGFKGFAFVEFEYPEVAKVAAETMDNYLMFQSVVKALYIPPEHKQYNYFRSSVKRVKNKVGKPIYVGGKTASVRRKVVEHNSWSDEEYQKRIDLNIRKLQKIKEKYAHLGIDFDEFTVRPKIQKVDKSEEPSPKKEFEEGTSTGSIPLSKNNKRKSIKTDKSAKKSKVPKVKKIIELEDLLGSTLIQESSGEDEDFIPGVEEDSPSSDEEDCVFEKAPQFKKVTSNKPRSKVDVMAELIRRKPNFGGIQRHNKATKVKHVKSSSAMSSLQNATIKEMKQLGKVKQMKKRDFNKANKKKV